VVFNSYNETILPFRVTGLPTSFLH